MDERELNELANEIDAREESDPDRALVQGRRRTTRVESRRDGRLVPEQAVVIWDNTLGVDYIPTTCGH